MEVTSDIYGENEKARIKDILGLIKSYKTIFHLSDNYSIVRLWVKMKKYYDGNWCLLHWFREEFEKGKLKFPIHK